MLLAVVAPQSRSKIVAVSLPFGDDDSDKTVSVHPPVISHETAKRIIVSNPATQTHWRKRELFILK